MHGEPQNEQAEGAGEIAMDHLVPALFRLHRRMGEIGLGVGQLGLALGHADEAVAAGPVRATEAGVGQTGIGAQRHHHQGQQSGEQGEAVSGPVLVLIHSSRSSPFRGKGSFNQCWKASAGGAGR
ncbi:hypothetical protein FQZ97_947380 [compost metagenome]